MKFISQKYKPIQIEDFLIKDNFVDILNSFITIENLNLIFLKIQRFLFS